MSQGLFWQEVIEAKRGEWLGSIIVATPLSRWGLAALALILAAAIVLFLLLGHYTPPRETVTGQQVPSAGVLTVAAPGVGTVTRLHVRGGQRMNAGDALSHVTSRPPHGQGVRGHASATSRQAFVCCAMPVMVDNDLCVLV